MKFNRLLASALFLSFFVPSLFASDSQVLIFGKLIDEKTGETIGAQFEIFGPDGSRVKLKSSQTDGLYQQILASGKKYTVKFNDYNIIPSTDYFQTLDSGKYIEQKVDFKLNKLIENKVMFQLNAFANKSADIDKEADDLLKSFEDFYFKNRSMNLIIKVNANDAFWKTIKETKTEAKPAKKAKGKKMQETEASTSQTQVIEPDANEVKTLVDKRVEALKNRIANIKIFHNRLDVQADYSLKEIKDGSENQAKESNCIIISGPVVDKFK